MVLDAQHHPGREPTPPPRPAPKPVSLFTLASRLHISAWGTRTSLGLTYPVFLSYLYLPWTLLVKSIVIGLFTHKAISKLIPTLADNVIYSLQKGKSTAKWPLVYLEVLPFTLSLPVYLQTCTREKKIFTWWCCSVSCYLGVISDSFPHFNPLEPVTKSQRFQWFPLSLTVQVLPVRFLH